MFDDIADELYCPYCGTKQGGFQTHDAFNMLLTIQLKEVKDEEIEVHSTCEQCDKWISIIADTNAKTKYMHRAKSSFK